VKNGKSGTWHIEIDETNYQEYSGYAWDCRDARSTGAGLSDTPTIANFATWLLRIWSPYSFEARSMAKCVAGRDAGKIYAVVAWGFEWAYDGTPTGIGPLIQ